MGWVVTATTRPLYPREGNPLPIVQKAGWPEGSSRRVREISPYRIRSPGRPVRSELVYRLRYAGPPFQENIGTKLQPGPVASCHNFVINYILIMGARIAQSVQWPGYELDDPGIIVRIPAGAGALSLLESVQIGCEAQTFSGQLVSGALHT